MFELRYPLNLTGHTFGRLTPRKRSTESGASGSIWLCDCKCGRSRVPVARCNLISGHTKSCGSGCLFHTGGMQDVPPSDGIPLQHARDEFGIAVKTISKLIDKGDLKAGISYEQIGGRRGKHKTLLVSRAGLTWITENRDTRQHVIAQCEPPQDGRPIYQLAKELGVRPQTLERWCEWDYHPALGRKLASGFGPFLADDRADGQKQRRRGLLVSRADAVACSEALKNPLFKKFPDNPGIWIAFAKRQSGKDKYPRIEAVFKHDDGRLFFTQGSAEHSFNFPFNALCHPCYRGKLDKLSLVLPGAPGPISSAGLRWSITVFSEQSLNSLGAWRQGRNDTGRWLTENDLWRDGEGNWYSSMLIARHLQIPVARIGNLRRDGLLERHKRAPRDPGTKEGTRNRGGSVRVHHEEYVLPLLGLTATENPTHEANGLAATNAHSLKISNAALISGINPGVISRAVDEDKIKNNGQKGRARRLDAADFTRWQLERSNIPDEHETDDEVRRKLARSQV